MKKILSMCCLVVSAIIFESSSIGTLPPIGIVFNDYSNSFSQIIESDNGLGWRVVNYMKSGTLRASFSVYGGNASCTEGVTLSHYSAYKVGALAPNESGLIAYTISGTATCGYSSDDRAPYGVISCYYYRSDMN